MSEYPTLADILYGDEIERIRLNQAQAQEFIDTILAIPHTRWTQGMDYSKNSPVNAQSYAEDVAYLLSGIDLLVQLIGATPTDEPSSKPSPDQTPTGDETTR